MDLLLAIIISIVATAVWEILRRLSQYLHKVINARRALKGLFELSGIVVISRSIVKGDGKRFIRDPDARVAGEIIALLNEPVSYEDRRFSFDRPAAHLVVTGSPRYNEHAELLQKYYAMPYEYIFGSFAEDPGSRVLKIVTEHGDELASSRDHRVGSAEIEVDYGILFLGNLSNDKKVIWISGIHGIGTIGAFQYLKENASQISAALGKNENSGVSWLLRVQYKNDIREGERVVTDVELLGKPRECSRKESTKVPKALICDLGKVIMDFDRTRTYRAIAYFLDMPFEEVRKKVESTDLRARYERGALTDEEFCAELSSVIGDSKQRIGHDLISEFWGDIFWLSNEMFEALRCLKRQGVILILLSNTNHLHFQHIAKDYPDLLRLFDGVVLSYEEKKAKPDRDLFMTAIKKVQACDGPASVEDMLYVDDKEEYVHVANTLGLRGFVFRSYPHFIFWIRKMGLHVP